MQTIREAGKRGEICMLRGAEWGCVSSKHIWPTSLLTLVTEKGARGRVERIFPPLPKAVGRHKISAKRI